MISTLINDIISRVSHSHLNTQDKIDPSQLKALLTSALQKVDIVSRDEFDAQAAVLLRTRERLQQLEKQLLELEKTLPKSE
jgi:BMFP domain-containing protein YqiC